MLSEQPYLSNRQRFIFNRFRVITTPTSRWFADEDIRIYFSSHVSSHIPALFLSLLLSINEVVFFFNITTLSHIMKFVKTVIIFLFAKIDDKYLTIIVELITGVC